MPQMTEAEALSYFGRDNYSTPAPGETQQDAIDRVVEADIADAKQYLDQ
jgi:hypothetical protein